MSDASLTVNFPDLPLICRLERPVCAVGLSTRVRTPDGVMKTVSVGDSKFSRSLNRTDLSSGDAVSICTLTGWGAIPPAVDVVRLSDVSAGPDAAHPEIQTAAALKARKTRRDVIFREFDPSMHAIEPSSWREARARFRVLRSGAKVKGGGMKRRTYASAHRSWTEIGCYSPG
jgi:hypothetical protein